MFHEKRVDYKMKLVLLYPLGGVTVYLYEIYGNVLIVQNVDVRLCIK